MTLTIFIALMTTIAVIKGVSHDMRGPTSATHEEAKGANGPAEPRHDCDQCSDRDI